jgi:hypothetical protein
VEADFVVESEHRWKVERVGDSVVVTLGFDSATMLSDYFDMDGPDWLGNLVFSIGEAVP